MLNNIPQVTKNLLILNVLMYIVTFIMLRNGVTIEGMDFSEALSLHTFSSPLFKPYQLVTHFFMHDPNSILHIFFNMFVLVTFGGLLEKLWGPRRFFILYIISAFSAVLLYNGISEIQIMGLKETLVNQGIDYHKLYEAVLYNDFNGLRGVPATPEALKYIMKINTPMLGASGAIFGVTAAFAILFPNTQLQLLFPPIPIKAKYLIGGYFLLEVILSFYSGDGDHVAHLAHVGGAIGGAVLVLLWRRDRTKFY